jgi:SsrA-binding protein
MLTANRYFMKVIVQNKKALFDYEIVDRFEAGLVLTGDEVKSVRAGHVSLVGAFATIHSGQLMLLNCNISPYANAANKQGEEYRTRSRVLLVHRKEIARLIGDISRKGVTLVALKMYLNNRGLVKVEIGVAKHKKSVDKKQSLKERDIKRQTARELRDRE